MKRTTLLERAEYAVAQRLRSLKGNEIFRSERPGYTRSPEENLIPVVTRKDFWEDLQGGDGSELSDSAKAPAKFCAAYSSSALVVNTFGPFRHSPGHLVLAGCRDFVKALFERKCPTGLKGIPPNLDFFAAGPKILVAVESKFLETLRPKKALFKDSYNYLIQTQAEPAWQGMYKALLEDPTKFHHLDVAQLVKHYLGIQNTFRDCRVAKVLLYLYWEPENADSIPEFENHRHEVALFSEEVEGSEIRFVALAYPQLWQNWSKVSEWGGMLAHLDALRQRYELSI